MLSSKLQISVKLTNNLDIYETAVVPTKILTAHLQLIPPLNQKTY